MLLEPLLQLALALVELELIRPLQLELPPGFEVS
jgi:hypothetical protein